MDDPDLPFDSLITVRFDRDEQTVVFDLGDLDEYSAVTILRQVADHVEQMLPVPRDINDPPEEEDDEE